MRLVRRAGRLDPQVPAYLLHPQLDYRNGKWPVFKLTWVQFDLKTRKMFLKRMACADVTMDKLFLGSIVSVYSRQLKLVDYGDAFTRTCFAKNKESSFMLIKPDAYTKTGKIINHLERQGFKLSNLKMGRFTPATTARFLQANNCASAEASEHMLSDVSTGIEVVAENASSNMQQCCDALQKQFG